MDILKTFDLFWSLPEKLFGKKFFKVCHVETATGGESSIHADIDDDEEEASEWIERYWD